MVRLPGCALRMMVASSLVLGALAGAGGAARMVRAHRAAAVAQPTVTVPTSLAVDQSGGYVFVTAGRFSTQNAGAVGSGRLLVVATRGGTQVLRRVVVGSGPASVLVDAQAGRALVVNLGGGNQYAGYTGSSVSVLDLAALEHGGQNSVLHTTPLPGQLVQQVAIDRTTGRTFVGSWLLATVGQVGKGRVTILDTRTGTVVHTVALNTVNQALAVDEAAGEVFVLQSGSPTGTVITVLDARSGKIVRTFPVGRTGAPMSVDGRTGRLFVATLRGVQVRSAQDGALLRTLSLGQMPATIIMDQQHGHVFVVTAGIQDSNDVYVANGLLCMLDARTGMLLKRVSVGINLPAVQFFTGIAPPIVVVNRSGDRVFVANSTSVSKEVSQQERGTISVVQVSNTGLHLLRTTPLNPTRTIPTTLGMDMAANQVFTSTQTTTENGASAIGLTILNGQTGTNSGTISLSM